MSSVLLLSAVAALVGASSTGNTGPLAPINFGTPITATTQVFSTGTTPPGVKCAEVLQTTVVAANAPQYSLALAATYAQTEYDTRCVTASLFAITSQKAFDTYASEIADGTRTRWYIDIQGTIIYGKIREGTSDQNDCIRLSAGAQFFGSISLQGGDDTVQIASAVGTATTLHGSVSMGAGEDLFMLGTGVAPVSTHGAVVITGSVETGDDADYVYGYSNQAFFQGTIDTGSGRDTVRLQRGVTAHHIDTSQENDLISISGAMVSSINSGSDSDEIVITDTATMVGTISTESGLDSVYVLGVATLTADATVKLLNNNALTDYPVVSSISTGSGDDCFFGVHGSVKHINLGSGNNLLMINDFYTGSLYSEGGQDQFYVFSSLIDGDVNMGDGIDYLRLNAYLAESTTATNLGSVRVNGDIYMGGRINTAVVDLDTVNSPGVSSIVVNGKWHVSNLITGNVCKISAAPSAGVFTFFIRDGTVGCQTNNNGFSV